MRHTEYDVPDLKDAVLKEDLTHIFEDPLLPPFLETMGSILTERNRTYRDNRRERNLAHLANIGDEAAIVLGLDERKKEDLLEKYNRIILHTAEKFKRKTYNFRHNTTGEDEDGLAHMFLQISQATVRFDWQEFVDNKDEGYRHFTHFVQASLYDSAAQTPEAAYRANPLSSFTTSSGQFREDLLTYSPPDPTNEIDTVSLSEILSSIDLTNIEKEAFILRVVSRQHIKDIAQILGVSNGRVENAISRVRKSMRRFFKERDIEVSVRSPSSTVNPIWIDIVERVSHYQDLLHRKRMELPPFVEKVFSKALLAVQSGANSRVQIIESVLKNPEFKNYKKETVRRNIIKAAEALTNKSRLQARTKRSVHYSEAITVKKIMEDPDKVILLDFKEEEIRIIEMYYLSDPPCTGKFIAETLHYKNQSSITRKLMGIKSKLNRFL